MNGSDGSVVDLSSRKSAMVSGAGLLSKLFTDLRDKVHARGGTDDDIHRLVTPEGADTLDQVVDLIVSGTPHPKLEEYAVEVPVPGMSLVEIIERGGYSIVNVSIEPANFSVSWSLDEFYECVMVHFDYELSSEEAEAEMRKHDLEPAWIEQLLAFGAQHRRIRKEFPLVVALGSQWVGRSGMASVPGIWAPSETSPNGNLNLTWHEHTWPPSTRFLAIKA
jgi:hypothetical protein